MSKYKNFHSFFVLIILVLGMTRKGHAQEVDFDKVIPLTLTDSLSYIDRLVYWGWHNYSKGYSLEHEIKKAEKKIKLTRHDWTNNLTANFNLNERNINSDPSFGFDGSSSTNVIFPRYNFGIKLSIGDILVRPTEVNMAKYDLLVAHENLNSQKISFRTEVERRYELYLLKTEIFKHRVISEEDTKLIYNRVAEKFKKGEVTLEQFSSSQGLRNKSIEERTVSESEMKVAKLELEEVLGTKLESIK
jgi:outer membrane protein TolC